MCDVLPHYTIIACNSLCLPSCAGHVEVQAACVEMLLKLAPLKVDAAFNVLKAWSASASRTGECCVLCEKIDSLNSFISDCSERKTSVT